MYNHFPKLTIGHRALPRPVPSPTLFFPRDSAAYTQQFSSPGAHRLNTWCCPVQSGAACVTAIVEYIRYWRQSAFRRPISHDNRCVKIARTMYSCTSWLRCSVWPTRYRLRRAAIQWHAFDWYEIEIILFNDQLALADLQQTLLNLRCGLSPELGQMIAIISRPTLPTAV